MADRTDLDALLVSALYGELTPAEEARLATHLESHPADRTALDGLTRTRDGIRERRLFDAQLEPSPGISARLMQEAARQSPRPIAAGGFAAWIDRLRRSFGRGLMAHPAMAAAATFVVVIGIAGTLYMRNGDMMARPSVATMDSAAPSAVATAHSAAPAPAAATPPEPEAVPTVAAQASSDSPAAAGSAYQVRLRDGEQPGAVAGTAAPAEADRAKAEIATQETSALAKNSVAFTPASVARPAAKPAAVDKAANRGIELKHPEPTVKDLDDATYAKARRAKKANALSADEDVASANGGGNAAPAAPPAPSKIANNNAPAAASVAAAPPPSEAPTTDGANLNQRNDSNSLSWAQRQHGQVIAAVKANNCTAAANAAAQLYSRAPDYYRANVANDRSVAPCLAYVDRQVQVEERKAAAKRANNANETNASPPAQKQ